MWFKIRVSDVVRIVFIVAGGSYLLATAGRGATPHAMAAKPQPAHVAPKPAESQAAGSKNGDAAPATLPISGNGLAPLDQIVTDAIHTRQIPGVALAVCKDGNLLVARSYGWTNLSTHEPLTLNSLFCLAGVSDLVTTTAVLKLVDEGRLSLDDRVYPLLGKPQPMSPASLDSRYEQITVRQLLLHSGGWNEKDHGDLMFTPAKIARRMHEKLPLSNESLLRYAVSEPLDFAPGTKSHHSNFGYFVARLVVERVSGQPYESYVRQHVLTPLGISAMRLEQAAPGYALHEVRRYDNRGLELSGGHTAIGAPHGSWLASTIDLAKLMSNLAGGNSPSVIKPASLATMLAMPPPLLAARKGGSHLGLGWDSVQGEASDANYHKLGAAAGVRTYVEHRPGGITWMLLMNSDGVGAEQGSASKDLVDKLRDAIDHTSDWPQRNLFPASTLAGPAPKPRPLHVVR